MDVHTKHKPQYRFGTKVYLVKLLAYIGEIYYFCFKTYCIQDLNNILSLHLRILHSKVAEVFTETLMKLPTLCKP